VELLSRVVKIFFDRIDAMESEGTTRMLEVYREKCVSVGRTIIVETETETLTGTCSGIGDEGELILETPCGPRGFHVADVTHAGLG
jgi:biotin-(acetyl-CoA carboxylase) ligase